MNEPTLVEPQVDALRAALTPLADPIQAAAQRRYMRDQFPFLGIATPRRRAAQKPVLDALAGADGDDLASFARTCWREPAREYQYSATDALRRHHRALEARHLDDVRRLIVTKSWWDTVDSLATHTVSPLVARHPELVATMDRWIDDDDIWLARVAILHQLPYKDSTDAERLFRYADRRADDTEFFIRKAIGWALRQYARTDPDAVVHYVAAREDVLSGLTRREAMKHLASRS